MAAPAPKISPEKVPGGVESIAKFRPPAFCYQPMGLADGPMQLRCPGCREVVTTRVQYVTGLFTWLNCMAIFCDCCISPFCLCCCCCLPFCMNAFKNTEHYCTKCNLFIGTRRLI